MIRLAEYQAEKNPIRATQMEFQWWTDRGMPIVQNRMEVMKYVEKLEEQVAALQRRVEELEERLQIDHCYVHNPGDPENPTKKVLTPEERKTFPDAILCLEADVQLRDEYIAELEAELKKAPHEAHG